MPKDTPEQLAAKQAAIQDALIGATEVPLDIMRTAAACVEHADCLARNGSRGNGDGVVEVFHGVVSLFAKLAKPVGRACWPVPTVQCVAGVGAQEKGDALPALSPRPRFVVRLLRQSTADSSPLGRPSGSFLNCAL